MGVEGAVEGVGAFEIGAVAGVGETVSVTRPG